VYGVNDVRQTEKLTTYQSPGIDKIPAELIKAEIGQFILRSINLLILFGIRRNCLTSGVNHCTYIYKKGDKTDCSNYQGISLLSATFKILSNILLSRLTPYVNVITGAHQSGF
jgi:hypothetical protein